MDDTGCVACDDAGYLRADDLWSAWVGAQSREEFMRYSPGQTPAAAIAEYLPRVGSAEARALYAGMCAAHQQELGEQLADDVRRDQQRRRARDDDEGAGVE